MPDCNDMVVIGSVDFEGREEMYEGLRKRVIKGKNSYYVFVEDGHMDYMECKGVKLRWLA